jgi:hypothetical protein
MTMKIRLLKDLMKCEKRSEIVFHSIKRVYQVKVNIIFTLVEI